VTKHQDYSGKYCPHRTLDMGWDRFLDVIKAEMEDNDMTVQESEKIIQDKAELDGTYCI